MDELFEHEREEEKRRRQQYCQKIRELFSTMSNVKTSTTWSEINELLKENVAWNQMIELDRLETFIQYIERKERFEEETKRRTMKAQERKNRERFRELLHESLANDKILNFKTKWKHYVHSIKDDERLLHMFKQHGSTPRELFDDMKESLLEKHKLVKDSFKKILKNNPEMFDISMSLDQFKSALIKFEEFQAFESRETNSLDFYANYLYDKYKKREEKSI